MTTLLTADDIVGCWAIMPTPATDDASDPAAGMTVNLDETARAVEALIAAGVDGILSLGTLGECGSLSLEEKRAFVGVAVETARGRVPFFGGATALGTREAIEQARMMRDLGAAGVMAGPSMWNRPHVDMAVQFYRDMAEALPDLALCVYANPYVFKFDFPPPFWAKVSTIPQVVMAKTATAGTYLRESRASGGRVRIMPMDSEFYAAARLEPETARAFWSSSASCGPAPAILLRDLVDTAKQTGDWTAARILAEQMGAAVLPIIAFGDFDQFHVHNTILEKGRIDAAGWMKAGPIRPPFHLAPDHIRDWARQGGEAWAKLHEACVETLAASAPDRKAAE